VSATPRTDAYIGDGNDDNMTEGEIAMCDFARTLETELAAVTKQRDELAEALKNILADARLTLPTIKAAVDALKSIEEGEP
jgi:hypothetical protein